jgi:hypothetical protein
MHMLLELHGNLKTREVHVLFSVGNRMTVKVERCNSIIGLSCILQRVGTQSKKSLYRVCQKYLTVVEIK